MDVRDPLLIDRDLSGLSAVLADAVFGGPPPTDTDCRAWFTAHLPCGPWRVVALQTDAALPVARSRTWTWLTLHPGLAYLVSSGKPPLARMRLPRGLLAGESQPIAAPGALITALQQAVVSLRRRELASLSRRHAQPLDFTREREARDLVVARLRSGGSWDEAFAWWSEIVLLRHQYQLNAVRRKLVELLAQATRDVDLDRNLSWPFRSCIDGIYRTAALTPLMAVARTGLATISPLLAAPPTAALPPALARALDWLAAHQHEAISLRHAAGAAGVSPAHLARQARSALGHSILEHLTDLRLSRARELLAQDDLSITAVAARCGFPSHEHFHRVFRRRLGVTPGAWRSGQSRSL